MPRVRGSYRGNYAATSGSRFAVLNDYHEHDDRDQPPPRQKQQGGTTRRVSFKPSQPHNKGGGGGRLNSRMAEMALRSRLEDDEDMGDFASNSKYEGRPGPRRKGSPIPRKNLLSRKLIPSDMGWYQVMIQSGQRYQKEELIRAVLNVISPDIFIPHYWRAEKNCVIFFVDDFHIAERLQQIDRSIQMPDGYRPFIRVRSGTPLVMVDEPLKERMKLVMAKRYNANTRALDLSKFHADPDFKNVFCALFRAPVMSAALDIIEANIPDLVALKLNDNNISTMESFKNMPQRLPHLKILYLGENKIPSLAHLLVLRNVPLVELELKNNPLRQRYKDHSLYVSEVRRKFPKIVKLDGDELEPQILFDVNDTAALPQPKASYICNPAATDIIRQFLEQYFLIFDSDNRQPLLDAYHEQAMMSISMPPASVAGRLQSFWKFNRNFRRVMNNEDANKIRQLKVGRLSVVSTLAEWPKTQHDRATFTVDCTLFTPQLMSFTVAGLFKEFGESSGSSTSGGSNSSDIRHFQRIFVIVPAGSGFCIRNEMIFITSATNPQIRSFQRPASIMGGNNSSGASTSAAASGLAGSLQSRLQLNNQTATQNVGQQMSNDMMQASTPQQPDDNTKMQMIQAICAQTNMNIEWSRKCLEETQWDFNQAKFAFDKLQKDGLIPAEAFNK